MKLINSDCLEEMKDMSDNTIDFLFADLPYGQTSCKWDCLIDLDLFWKQVNRVCKQEAVMAFTCSVKFGNTLINSNPKCFRYDLIWVKSSACGFLNAKKMPMKKHEMVYIFYRKLPKVYTENIALHHTHKFLKEENDVVETRDTTNYKNESDLYGNIERPDFKRKNNESMYAPPLPNTILEIKSEKGKHATQKPVALMEWLIKYYTREGDVVLDPTMGSGGTGIACKNLNRDFIGIEKDEEIYKVALERNLN
jgi:DNA modification methylase